jgi:glycosyltransferase involved in cell wall biosynthesis
MKEEMLISVVIPTYNRSDYLIEALNSVINQTYKNIEIIIVDDGSKDNTKEVVNNYIELHKTRNIRYYYKENGGVATARNFGIHQSNGILIAFLDSDDLLKKEKLSKQVKLFDNPKVGLVHSHYSIMKEFGEIITNKTIKQNKLNGYMYNKMRISNLVGTSTVIVKKECINTVGLFEGEYSPAEDYDLWLRISKEYEFGYLEESLAYYREFSSDNISRNLTKMENGVIKILDKHWNNIKLSNQEKEEMKISYSRFYSYLSTNYYQQNNIEKFLEYYIKSTNIKIGRYINLPNSIEDLKSLLKEIKYNNKISTQGKSYFYFRYSIILLKEKKYLEAIKNIIYSLYLNG